LKRFALIVQAKFVDNPLTPGNNSVMKYFYNHSLLSSSLIIAFASIWISLTIFIFPSPDREPRYAVPQQGFLAPDIRLTDLNGELVHIADYKGQVILVNIWASWCTPCKAEMPAIQRMYDKYKEQGFVVLAVNATNQDNLKDVIAFADNQQLTFPILLDVEGTISKRYQVQALPTSFFISSNGLIDEVVIGGPMAEALLDSRISSLLGR
jgi:peroxiredoxin